MGKIVCLIPCYNKDNTREKNNRSIQSLLNKFSFDKVVIYDQGFIPSDYRDDCEYIGHQENGAGFVEPRNCLLKWFYNSDYDWAWWIDANGSVSAPTANDLYTMLDACRNDKLNDVDAVFSTLGIIVDADRIKLKQEREYKEFVTLIPATMSKRSDWFHGMFLANLKKRYNEEPLIDPYFDPRKNNGLVEDVYFVRLLKAYYSSYHLPTLTITKPNSNFSTHKDDGTGKYNYAPTDYDTTDLYISKLRNQFDTSRLSSYRFRQPIKLERVDTDKQLLKEYQPRTKQVVQKSLFM